MEAIKIKKVDAMEIKCPVCKKVLTEIYAVPLKDALNIPRRALVCPHCSSLLPIT